MFWRSDPTGNTRLMANTNWPRDGAVISGKVVTLGDEKWLMADRVKQPNGDWLDAPTGAFLPFEYDNHYFLEPAV